MMESDPSGGETTITPIPSDWHHAKTLMALSFHKDKKKPKLWALKILLQPAMLMLYTISMFMGYNGGDDGSYIVGKYLLFEEEDWTYPNKINIGAANFTLLDELVGSFSGKNFEVVLLNATTSDEVVSRCQGNIDRMASEEICAFISSESEYTLYFGGEQEAFPMQHALAGAQFAINTALLNASNIDEVYPASQIQQVPQLHTKETVQPALPVLLVSSIMYVLAAVLSSAFVAAAITNEKINGISKSYLSVGVKMETYLLQWLAYYSLHGIVSAGILTLVCIYFKLMPMSNGGLIYISNYFGLVQLYATIILTMQFLNSEEMASGVVWLMGFFSMGVGAGMLVLYSADHAALTLLTVFFPLIGMMQYFGIYITYDYTGFNTGIHPGMNVVSSGLLNNMIAQMCGIVCYVALMLLYSRIRRKVLNFLRVRSEQVVPTLTSDESDKFEQLSPDKEVVLSLKGLHHTYYPSRLSCNKDAKPVSVLKGLSMDLCKGEVFGYLGHNGAGKSTSVDVLSTELALEHGNVIYHFRDGDASLGDPTGDERIRQKIGVCPQHNDSLQASLTCRETLTLFARLKGGLVMKEGQTVEDALHDEVDQRLLDVKFTSDEDCDKPVGTFSGGMKRKVLIAVALLGDPEVVFLDEPTAGLDPYNRRIIWDMIIEAKRGRSIVLTTHFLDEADVLSDRIGIIKNGRLVTCGSSLFLKHTLGAGYSLKFNCAEPIDVAALVQNAVFSNEESDGERQHWSLNFGSEKQIPDMLLTLTNKDATDISLELTTLEDVFLKTGKEDFEDGDEEEDSDETPAEDVELGHNKEESQARIWEQRATITPLTDFRKLRLVEQFVRSNAFKMPGAIFLNISMPLVYMVVGLIVVSMIEIPTSGEKVSNPPIQVSSPGLNAQFFGVEGLQGNTSSLFQPVPEPMDLDDYFGGFMPIIGGYYAGNSTLQYASDVDGFALQFSAAALANFSAMLGGDGSLEGIATSVQQLPYVLDSPFRFDLLFLPMMLSFGFAGLAFTVLDVLLLKGNNIVEIFRVAGITEWLTYIGVAAYKTATSFIPFFTLAVILCVSLKSVLVGNGGRWLGTLLVMMGYAYSGTPVGLILAKKYVRDYKETANWFPGVYYTFVALPYVAWSIALQAVPSAEHILLVIGDVLCVVPFFGFQRGLGAIIGISTEYDDANLSWNDVWAFETRIWYTILVMIIVGTLEWLYLFTLTTKRAPRTHLTTEEAEEYGTPLDTSKNPDTEEEYGRSQASNEGINARKLVKVFVTKTKSKKKVIKQAVKGVSFGIRKNEIYTLLGPNGAGKTTVMNILAGVESPEHGEIAVCSEVAAEKDVRINHLYGSGDVAFCPQFDALFPKKTVGEHIKFYATIRGMDFDKEATQNHLAAIVKLLGLEKYRSKLSTDLSGGYKRRLCLAISMIGYPKVMMLDECTTGLDPAARHLVWDVLKPENKNGYDVPAILLSSHYMDECQHLGTRIGIMIDGELVATGSLNRLQELYCTGLFVEISLLPNAVDDCNIAELQAIEAFSELKMEATVYESLPFHFKLKVNFQQGVEISNNVTQLAEAFRLLEGKKEELGIQFYSIALMNLEQIFIDLSRKQFDAEDT